MTEKKPRLYKTGELDARIVQIDFTPELREGFRELAAALHFSDHVSSEVHSIIHDWGETQKPSVADVVVCLPKIAQDTLDHIHATGDKRAAAAWNQIKSALIDHETHGITTLQNNRWRTR